MKSETLILGCVYPGVESYMEDYLNSIWKQTHQDFDLLILGNGPALELRLKAIAHAVLEGYKYLVFTDTDDFFSSNRVRLSLTWLQKGYDFVFNEIELVGILGDTLEHNVLQRIGVEKEYGNVDAIIDRNIFGLSTTAVKVECLRGLEIPKNIIALDWWIYTMLLLGEHQGKFLKNAITYYRQTGDNLVGMGGSLDEKRLKRGVEVKSLHYENAALYEGSAIFKRKRGDTRLLEKKLEDDVFKKKYIEVINKNMKEIYNGWWSEILSLGEWEKYE